MSAKATGIPQVLSLETVVTSCMYHLGPTLCPVVDYDANGIGPSNGLEATEDNALKRNEARNLQCLREAELRYDRAHRRLKELALNIRLKEELIKELVKTGTVQASQSVSVPHIICHILLYSMLTQVEKTVKMLDDLEADAFLHHKSCITIQMLIL